MKLLNQSITYLSVSILFIISLWAVIFYFNMLNEIKESIDEGLENYKRQIIFKAQKDASLLSQNKFEEGFFAIQKITQEQAFSAKDAYMDTFMYMQDADDENLELEPVRMLTTAFETNGNYYELKIINSMVEEDDLIEELLWEVAWLYLILLTSIIVINNLVLKRLWKPFYNFLHELKYYRLGKSTHLPEVKTKTKEFIDLQNVVNGFIKQSIETFEQQKQFIGNASHELQTPLAITINKLELLVEKGNLQETQAQSIAEVMHTIERLIKLNKSLLLLTKIENKQFLENQTIDINKVVHQNLEDLEEIVEFKNIEISLIENSNLMTKMDPTLANIVVSNMIRNAIFHNFPNGQMHIEIKNESLKISNTAKNEALDSEKIFTRFYKSEQEQSSSGLGLSIVKAICNLYGFTVLYHFENKQHHFLFNFNK